MVFMPEIKSFNDKSLKKFPGSAVFEITPYCNFKCKHCYVNTRIVPSLCDNRPVFSLDEYKNIIDQLEQLGVIFLNLTGGEPLLRNDFFEIWKYAYNKGIKLSVFTNASLINENHISLFKNYPGHIQISLYGYKKETYFNLTGVEIKEKVYDSINLLINNNIKFHISYIANKLTIDDLNDAKKFFLEKAPFTTYSIIDPHFNEYLYSKDIRLPIDTTVELILEENKEELQKIIDRSNGKKRGEKFYTCQNSLKGIYITPYLEYSFCSYGRNILSLDLRKLSVAECITSMKQTTDNQKKEFAASVNCQKCQASIFCLSCPASAKVFKNDMRSKVDYYCIIAHKLYQKLKKCK